MASKIISLNINYRPQLLVGLLLGIWLYLFLVLVGPFDAAELSLSIRTFLMLGYGLLFFLSYAVLIPIQNRLFELAGGWKFGYELAMITLFCAYCLPVNYAYYKTEAVNGTESFGKFALTIYLPTMAILLPVIIIGRYLISKNSLAIDRELEVETVVLKGENKLDILKLSRTDLVAFEAANNYVAIHYLQNGQLQKKLLRSSLRKMHDCVPEMVQTHRSYLVNPHHFVEWKDGLTLVLTQLSVPVSQKYKQSLHSKSAFVPK